MIKITQQHPRFKLDSDKLSQPSVLYGMRSGKKGELSLCATHHSMKVYGGVEV